MSPAEKVMAAVFVILIAYSLLQMLVSSVRGGQR